MAVLNEKVIFHEREIVIVSIDITKTQLLYILQTQLLSIMYFNLFVNSIIGVVDTASGTHSMLYYLAFLINNKRLQMHGSFVKNSH